MCALCEDMNEIGVPRRIGWPVVRWKVRMQEYMHERVDNKRGSLSLSLMTVVFQLISLLH